MLSFFAHWESLKFDFEVSPQKISAKRERSVPLLKARLPVVLGLNKVGLLLGTAFFESFQPRSFGSCSFL